MQDQILKLYVCVGPWGQSGTKKLFHAIDFVYYSISDLDNSVKLV